MDKIVLSRKYEARQWAKNKNLSQVPLNGEAFAVGDVVTFKNDYGVEFEGNRIIGFTVPLYPNSGTVYLDSDAYWFPNRPEQLTKSTN